MGLWREHVKRNFVIRIGMRYAARRKVAGLNPDVIAVFKFALSFQPHYGPGVDSASNKIKYQESYGGGGGGVPYSKCWFRYA
jgi:hypothetical protein